jgi:hypothetical protein
MATSLGPSRCCQQVPIIWLIPFGPFPSGSFPLARSLHGGVLDALGGDGGGDGGEINGDAGNGGVGDVGG